MDEFEAIAAYTLRDLELPKELRQELIKRFALVAFWQKRLTLNGVQRKVGELKAEIENELSPSDEMEKYGNWKVASDLDRIHRGEFEEEG